MQVRGRRWEQLDATEKTARIMDSEGGLERLWVVARRMETWRVDTWRRRDRDAVKMEALSLRM